ncbi:aspartate-semialdehyde dehydrogenase [Bdellovibrio bacteriovorus W]|nr:aspartate-semialdehyde dehydrogenase [Bdellovibrio bacteriovorus W]
MERNLKIGVVGATGMVGQAFMEILAQRKFPVSELRPFASESSLGKSISLNGQQWPVQTLQDGCFAGLDLVFFSSGDEISAEWAPKAVAAGAYAIDNSAAFRMNPEIALVVPEVNGHLLKGNSQPCIIANPNCSTIQLVVALKPLVDKFSLKSVKVSTYQAVSGAGQAGQEELIAQTQKYSEPTLDHSTFPHQILFNCIPQIGSFNDQGFCSEEMKIMLETRKILGLPELPVSAFTVRVPVLHSHSESVWVTLGEELEKAQFTEALSSGQGLQVVNEESQYPTPLKVSGEDPVYVGRIHRDMFDSKTWLMWVVSDNIRKGAALNGIHIAEKLFGMNAKNAETKVGETVTF